MILIGKCKVSVVQVVKRYLLKFHRVKFFSLGISKEVYLPSSFYPLFDEESYTRANPEVIDLVRAGKYESAIDYFYKVGYWEVKSGNQRIGNEFPYFDAEVYAKFNPDFPVLSSSAAAFKHFISYGYAAFKSGKRVICGYYPLMNSELAEKNIKKHFDEKSYLQANPDVLLALRRGGIRSAWDHFRKYGIFEAQKQGRPLSPVVGRLTEPEYLLQHPKLNLYVQEGAVKSPFEYFICTDLQEAIKGKKMIHPYGGYFYREPIFAPELRASLLKLDFKPLISIIIPGFDLDFRWLREAVESIERQWYRVWEICIACDEKLTLSVLSSLGNINQKKIKLTSSHSLKNSADSLNKALLKAEGEYITCLASTDEFTPDALYKLVQAVNKGAEFIFSDEDYLNNEGKYVDPIFKPDFTPDRLMSYNYIGNLFVIKRSLINHIRGWSVELSGAENHDLFLRVQELTDKIYHIPEILYHSRAVDSVKVRRRDKHRDIHAGVKSLECALKRRDVSGEVQSGDSLGTYNVSYHISTTPLVSIIVEMSHGAKLFKECIEAILKVTTYQNFEIIGVIATSLSHELKPDEMIQLEGSDSRIRLYELNQASNSSLIKNYAALNLCHGAFLVFMNSRIVVSTPRWVDELLMHSQRESVGCVGTLLLNEDETIHHAGYILSSEIESMVVSLFSGGSKRLKYSNPSLSSVCNYNAMTADLLMLRKGVFKNIGGFNNDFTTSLYRDIDLSLRVKHQGLYNVYTPFAEAIFLGQGECDQNSLQQLECRASEAKKLRDLHSFYFDSYDSSYNPNLSVSYSGSQIAPHVSRLYRSFIGRVYEDKLIKSIRLRGKHKSRVCIFSHYDNDNYIDHYVQFYLSKLSKYYDIVFVTTSEKVRDKELKKISPYCISYIVKPNEGYDFGAWKAGLDHLSSVLDDYESLLLCNDSVYGPMQDLGYIIDMMDSKKFDVWSMSDSYELGYHLQSYFIHLNRKAFTSKIFKDFWGNFKIYDDKKSLIRNCEVAYSAKLISSKELNVGSYYSIHKKSYLNNLQYYWDFLLKDKFPFLKIEVLRDNPLGLDIHNYKSIVRKNTCYNPGIIEAHLKRVS